MTAGLRDWRRRLLRGAQGATLELHGFGTARNLGLYPDAVTSWSCSKARTTRTGDGGELATTRLCRSFRYDRQAGTRPATDLLRKGAELEKNRRLLRHTKSEMTERSARWSHQTLVGGAGT